MEPHRQIIQDIKKHTNIASRANSMTLTEEDIRIFMVNDDEEE